MIGTAAARVADGGPPLLELRGVSKRFGGLAALSDVSFSIAPREAVGLIGPNGAGKSTLFDVITGFVAPDSGSVRLGGREIVGRARHAIARSGIGRTFQKLRPFLGMTLLENVMVPLVAAGHSEPAAERHARECIDFVGLSDKASAPAGTLSTGQRKRLELARAMALGPRLLLLDEVTAGVDERSLGPLVELLERLHRTGATLLMIEHNMRIVARIASRIVMLHLGRVVAEGSPAEILNDPHVTAIYAGEHHHD